MQSLASRAYGQVTARTASDQNIEYALFQQITHALQGVAEAETPEPAIWADAIDRNMKLWAILTVDLLSPENALPNETKAGLLSLANFVRQQSQKVLAGNEGLDDLIEVNQTIMGGMTPAGGGI
ncbi:MAG: flagellar biosynthesis regulator FlaF [Hyphomonadaceae bacterium]|nr:flagellar biosynthesis regulator FlaF [Hyphomonadaceae bacterium]